MDIRVILAAILAIVLVVLYFYTMYLEINIATACPGNDQKEVSLCEARKAEAGSFAVIFSAVGGIVSAFAVGILAINKPAEGLPTEGLASAGSTGIQSGIAKAIPIILVLTWLVCGLAAVYFGLKYSGSSPLTEMAKAWIGTAVAGVGAFVGLKT